MPTAQTYPNLHGLAYAAEVVDLSLGRVYGAVREEKFIERYTNSSSDVTRWCMSASRDVAVYHF